MKVQLYRVRRWLSTSLADDSRRAYVRKVDVSQHLAPRALQDNAGARPTFACATELKSLLDVEAFARSTAESTKAPSLFVLDAGDDDFGSRANFGRGHNHDALESGCPTSFDMFLKRATNIAISDINRAFAEVRSFHSVFFARPFA